MLDFAAVRVGFVTQLLWERYGALWLSLVRDAGSEPVLPEREAVRAVLDDPRVAAVPALTFRLAAAQALSLAQADVIFVPELNPDIATEGGSVARGGAGDPWVADFPDALRSAVAGLPPLVAVPASLDAGVEASAVTALQNLVHDAHSVRRIWGRRRAEARPVRLRPPRWTKRPEELRTVGLVGQPWVLSDGLASRLRDDGDLVVGQHRLDPRELRQEAQRMGEWLAPTDAEVLGAGRLFGRRGGIDVVRVVADRGSGADAWLVDRLRATIRKPVEVRYLQDVLAADDAIEVLMPSVAGGA